MLCNNIDPVALLLWLMRFPNFLLQWLLLGVRSLLGPAFCRFSVGCTAYAVEQLQQEHLPLALWRIAKRVVSCNPWNKNVN